MKLIILDLECTDSDLVKGDICEIGAWYMSSPDAQPDHSFQSYLKPLTDHRDPEAMASHEISEETLQNAPYCGGVLEDFVAWCRSVAGGRRYILSAWGVHFDIPYLRMQHSKVHQEYPHPGRSFDAKTYATAALVRQHGPNTQGARNCIKTADRLGADVDGLQLHSARDDALGAALAVRRATLILRS